MFINNDNIVCKTLNFVNQISLSLQRLHLREEGEKSKTQPRLKERDRDGQTENETDRQRDKEKNRGGLNRVDCLILFLWGKKSFYVSFERVERGCFPQRKRKSVSGGRAKDRKNARTDSEEFGAWDFMSSRVSEVDRNVREGVWSGRQSKIYQQRKRAKAFGSRGCIVLPWLLCAESSERLTDPPRDWGAMNSMASV